MLHQMSPHRIAAKAVASPRTQTVPAAATLAVDTSHPCKTPRVAKTLLATAGPSLSTQMRWPSIRCRDDLEGRSPTNSSRTRAQTWRQISRPPRRMLSKTVWLQRPQLITSCIRKSARENRLFRGISGNRHRLEASVPSVGDHPQMPTSLIQRIPVG